jgi:hypothetical protein
MEPELESAEVSRALELVQTESGLELNLGLELEPEPEPEPERALES